MKLGRPREIDRKRAIEIYNRTQSLRRTAEIVGCTHEAVRYLLVQEGVERRRLEARGEPSTHLGRLIRTKRVAAGLSLRGLASMVRAPSTYPGVWESCGKRPGLIYASRVAAALDIPLQDLADAAERDAAEKETR